MRKPLQQLQPQLHSKTKQKLLGISYTPLEIREELTGVVLDELSRRKDIKDVQIMDPCCGIGTFTITALLSFRDRGIPFEKAVDKNVYFSDIDKLSVAISLANIECFLNRHGVDATQLILNATVSDYFEIHQKFDGIISNPPYVKFQNLDLVTREKLKSKYPNVFSGSLGLSAVFLAKMFEDLDECGIVGVITQNNFFTSLAGRALREAVGDHVFKIDTFGSETLFEGVTAYTCLLYVDRNKCVDFSFRKINSLTGFNTGTSTIKNKDLNPSKWKLGSTGEVKTIKRLETLGTPLGLACRIWVGIATQMDKAFTVHLDNGKWQGCVDGQIFEIEAEIVRSLIKVSELEGPDDIKLNNRGIIYPYEIIDAKPVVISEEVLRENFPVAYQYLLHWKAPLLNRQKGRVKEEDWYKWGRIQSMVPVRGKLLTKTFDRYPTFHFDGSESLFSNGYAIVPRSNEFDIKFVQAVLQSTIFSRYIEATSFEIKGSYHCYQKNFIERFCLPKVSRDDQIELLKKNEIDDFLISYFEIKSEDFQL